MLKIFSKLKPTQTTTPNQAETAMLAVLASPEKTARLISQLEADAGSETKYSRRHLLNKKLDQARIAQSRHEIEAERQRVASVLRRDQATVDKALEAANEAHAKTTAELALHESKRVAVVNRLAPLEAERLVLEKAAMTRAADAQIEFDAAIAKDNAEAEISAADKLYQAKKACKAGIFSNSPLGLRIAALQCEIKSHTDTVSSTQSEIDKIQQARLVSQARLALLEYDRQAQALLDVWMVQKAAIRAVMEKTNQGQSILRTLGCYAVDLFESQFSSPERIVFGGQIDVYQQRHMPISTAERLCNAMAVKPNLSILTATFEDLPAEDSEPSESAEPEADIVAEATL